MTKLVLLNLKRKKKSWRMMLIVMTLAYTFLAMVLTFCSSLDRTEEAEREADYGSWHVALIHADLESIERMKNHATVERAGISYTYGMVLDLKEEDLGKIGTADEHTIEMEKIHLLEGRFPKGDGELAAERSALTALGYLGEPGQQVSVKIQISQGGEKREVQKDFTLVGIVQDYSSRIKGTTLDKKDYVSFFVDEAEEGFVPSEGNIVFRLKEKSLEFYNEILREKGIRAEGVANNYTYYELMRDSAHRQMEKKQEQFKMIILGLYLFWAIFISTIFTYLKSQKDSIMILRKIGHEKRKTKRLIYIELLGVHTVAFLLGNISGIFLSYGLFSFLGYMTEFTGCFFIEWESFIFLAAIEVISSLVLLRTSVMILVNDRMLANRKKRPQASKRKKFNWKVFIGKKDRVISGCMIFVVFLLVYMSVYTVGEIALSFLNNRLISDKLLNESWNVLVILIYVDFLCISLVLIYEKSRWELNVKKYEKRWKTYLYLGIPQNQFASLFIKEFLVNCIYAVACAYFSMIIYHYCRYWIKWNLEQEHNMDIMGEIIFSTFLNRVSWKSVVISIVLILGFMTVKTIYKVKKVLKNFKM